MSNTAAATITATDLTARLYESARRDGDAWTIEHNGNIVGYASRRSSSTGYSLNTASGLDLLSTPDTLAEALVVLADHLTWERSR
jgi:hypothetical protein